MTLLEKSEAIFEALQNTRGKLTSTTSTVRGKACEEYRNMQQSKNVCYEFNLPKMPGMTAEECLLLAIAVDLEHDQKCALLAENVIEMGATVEAGNMVNIVRIVVVTTEQKNHVELALL